MHCCSCSLRNEWVTFFQGGPQEQPLSSWDIMMFVLFVCLGIGWTLGFGVICLFLRQVRTYTSNIYYRYE